MDAYYFPKIIGCQNIPEVGSSSSEDRVRYCIPPGWNDVQTTQKLELHKLGKFVYV